MTNADQDPKTRKQDKQMNCQMYELLKPLKHKYQYLVVLQFLVQQVYMLRQVMHIVTDLQ